MGMKGGTFRRSLRFVRDDRHRDGYSTIFFRVLMFWSLKMLFPWGVYM
jgi:hypothetical protein